MSAKKEKNVEVTFANGWLYGQEVTEDDSKGERQLVAGLKTRLRLNIIWGYQVVEPGILAINVCFEDRPIFMVGSLDALDQIMARANLKEV